MRFLIDQDVYQVTVDQLKEWGHDVTTVRELEMQQAADESLLVRAREANRIFITRDKDFGALTFLKESLSTGVILLRLTLITVEMVHRELNLLFHEHNESELKELFCVVEPHRYRIRHLRRVR
jgi:predicted nuclease of predicted toxin-antitoxin system